MDPLDGTAEYAQGFVEHVTVLIGIAVDGNAVAGVVHQPFFKLSDGSGANQEEHGRTVWGIVGLGRNQLQLMFYYEKIGKKKLNVSLIPFSGAFGITGQSPPQGEKIITTTRSHGTGIVAEAVNACQ